MAELPGEYLQVPFDDARFVAGPTGVFVITEGADDIVGAGERAVSLAAQLRSLFAERLSWAPFVDALVVAEPVSCDAAGATVVPARHVSGLMTEGPRLIARDILDRMADVVRDVA